MPPRKLRRRLLAKSATPSPRFPARRLVCIPRSVILHAPLPALPLPIRPTLKSRSRRLMFPGRLGEGGHEGDPGDTRPRDHAQPKGGCDSQRPHDVEPSYQRRPDRRRRSLHVSDQYGSHEESGMFTTSLGDSCGRSFRHRSARASNAREIRRNKHKFPRSISDRGVYFSRLATILSNSFFHSVDVDYD